MPKSYSQMDLISFQKQFSTEEACRERLFTLRWPEGFRCPSCFSVLSVGIKRRSLLEQLCTGPGHRWSNGSGQFSSSALINVASRLWPCRERSISASSVHGPFCIRFAKRWKPATPVTNWLDSSRSMMPFSKAELTKVATSAGEVRTRFP